MGTHLLDKYSLLHVATGIIARYWNMSFLTWLLLHTVFELLENMDIGRYVINRYIVLWPGGKPAADTAINTVGDFLCAATGWLFAHASLA